MTPKSNYIKCTWGKVHYKEFNANEKETFICLHGWLDNWSSFLPLSEYFNHHLICIDLPGHGRSDHLAEGNWYHFVDYVVRLREILNNLKINKIHFIGHSMGAAIASLYCATFPEDAKSITLIDGLGPLVDEPKLARLNLKESILKRESITNKRRPFISIDLAIKARLSVGELSKKSAEILVKNQIHEDQDGIKWLYDNKLKFTSSLRLSPEQLESFFCEIKCPVLLICASEGFVTRIPYWESRKKIKNLEEIHLKGKHHLHMETPDLVSHKIEGWLSSLP